MPKKPDELRTVAIRCDKEPSKALNEIALNEDAFGINAHSFTCLECSQRWSMHDFAGAFEPETVTCSNCYSKKVLITAVLIIYFEYQNPAPGAVVGHA